MIETFLEYSQDEVTHADMRRLSGIRYECIGRYLDREPVKRKLGHLRMSDLHGCRFGGAVWKQFV